MSKNSQLEFDMGRKDYLSIIEAKYSNDMNTKATGIKGDKEYFIKHYNIDLGAYSQETKQFIIPYEMSDLYCLMMATMKSASIYDDRTKTTGRSMQDIVNHNKKIVDYLGNLPPHLSDYIKMSLEYKNALVQINYIPIIIERLSAIINLAVNTNDTPVKNILEYLIDGIDDVYDRIIWEKARKEITNNWIEENKESSFVNGVVKTTPTYYSLDYFLAGLFKKLNRDNWPNGVYLEAKALIDKLKFKYKNCEDKDTKIKYDYLFWLCNQKWHVLNKTIDEPTPHYFSDDNSINKMVNEYNNTYKNKNDTMEEIYKIKLSLQNVIDIYIIGEFLSCLDDIGEFNKTFKHPYVTKLSLSIYKYIKILISQEPSNNTLELLKLYLNSIFETLSCFDDKYKRYGISNYAEDILNGKIETDICCDKIYQEVFIKNQTKKCYYYNQNNLSNLKNSIGNTTGQMFSKIIESEKFTK